MGRKRTKVPLKRTRFTSCDIYKYIAIGEKSDIEGIEDYECNKEILVVQYDGNCRRTYFINRGVDEIKQVVRENHDKSVDFINVPDAEQYRETLMIRKRNNI